VTDEEIRESLADWVATIVNAVRVAWQHTPIEFSDDIIDRGIVLTGDGAVLKNLDTRLMQETHLPVFVSEDPIIAPVLGAATLLSDIELLQYWHSVTQAKAK
jgi:rod shape-determining protein MreB